MMKFVLSSICITLVLISCALADDAAIQGVGVRAAEKAMSELSFQKGDENILVLTNAGYAIVSGMTTQKALKGLSETAGCSRGNGNLFQVLRPHWKPLWFYFFNRENGEALYLQVKPESLSMSPEELKAAPDDAVFSRISKANVDLDHMLNNSDEGNRTFNEKIFDGNEFSLVGISNVWARNASFDFIQAASFHDHLCPGVTSGYMIAKYVEKELPINSSAESYKVIAVPPWCKDDALQLLWDATVGKSGIFVMALTDTEKNALRAKYNQSDVAGIFVRWNDTAKQGDALVLSFNWTRMYELTETKDWKGPSWAPKLVMDVRMMDYWDEPEVAVSVIKRFQVDQSKLAQLQNAGMHPLKVAGVM
ncbi:MAG TPA: FmdE family protein [Methanothrix sp.]|nr:FmdE family protein [Methanothrix sp.]HOK58854.1 FmdE family protein [Methanothrix sp.]HOL44026.1 FmdE family protein [Methanothrix sp.]HPO89128.1 FmdE family protein [Methanothrix sp.]